MIRLDRAAIRNYRAIEALDLKFHAKSTAFVGANNSGKSTILDALASCLQSGRRHPVLNDFRSTPEGSVKDIEVDVFFAPPDGSDTFDAALARTFEAWIDVGAAGQEIGARFRWKYDPETDSVSRKFLRLDPAGKERPGEGDDVRKLHSWIPTISVGLHRRADFTRGAPWQRTLKSRPMNQAAGDAAVVAVKAVNEAVRKAVPDLATLSKLLGGVLFDLGILSDVQHLDLVPVPEERRRLLDQLEILLRGPLDALLLPSHTHGDGTQSALFVAAILCYLDILLPIEVDNQECRPLLLVEEPENHFHPQLQRLFNKLLAGTKAQIVAATHSPGILRSLTMENVRVVRRGNVHSCVRIPATDGTGAAFLTPKEANRLDRHFGGIAAEMFFARGVLVCEGETEAAAVPVFARMLGLNLDLGRVVVAPTRGNDFAIFEKALGPLALNLPWLLLCDGDDAYKKAQAAIERGAIDGKRLRNLPVGENFETAMLKAGAEPFLKLAVEELLGAGKYDELLNVWRQQPAMNGLADEQVKAQLWKNGRNWSPPLMTELVALQMEKAKARNAIPPMIAATLTEIYTLAEKA
jgi:predicted ATP-dependent endonuclease of OLD family